MKVTVAVSQYDIGYFKQFDDFTHKLENWFKQAAALDAQLLVFPEYASMELASLFGPDVYQDLSRQLYSMQSVYLDYLACYQTLAKQYNMHVLAGSFPVLLEDGSFRNRANLVSPDGLLGYQDKLVMTRFENEKWIIKPGNEIKVFPSDLGTMAVNICYDSEFPLIARQQSEAGAHIILAPSCTDGQAGFYRVRIGCQARALENQCFVLQSPTIGDAPWSPAVDCNTGRASIYTPVDHGFPANGILLEAADNQAACIAATLDLSELTYIRQQGQVFNYRDWPKQYGLKK